MLTLVKIEVYYKYKKCNKKNQKDLKSEEKLPLERKKERMQKMGGDEKSKSRSRRKPLRDVSNGGFRHPPVNSIINKSNPATTCAGGGGVSGDPMDRLLLVHSDLSVLIHQVISQT